MGIFIFLVILVIAMVVWYKVQKYKTENGTIDLNEDKLIKKFNGLVKKINPRNIEDVKLDLFKILDKYKFIKCEQFIENRTHIQASRKQVQEQIRATDSSRSAVKDNILRLKRSENPDEILGAQLAYQYEKLGEMTEQLKSAEMTLLKKDSEFDRELDLFNSKFALKKAEVSMMIANAISLKNISSIDIRLEDLVSEFQQKVAEQENADYVRGKLYGNSESAASESTFDFDAYKQKFTDFAE